VFEAFHRQSATPTAHYPEKAKYDFPLAVIIKPARYF
jgi:hypothetical protein